MSKVRFVPLLTFSFLLVICLGAHAQVLTDRVTLQRASQQMDREDKELHTKLVSLARQKGWALTLRSRSGRMAYLMGIDTQGYPLYVTTTDNIISAATIGTNQLWPGGSTGLNLNGSSANIKGKIAVWDEGLVRPTHVELTGRVLQKDGATTVSDHSTHVSGTLIAAGVNPLAKGMSYGAQQLLTYDFNNDKAEMADAASNGLLVSSHSYATIAGWYYNDTQSRWEFWGASTDNVDYKFGYYDADAQKWDSIAYYAPNYLIVKAGGNNRSENGPAVGANYWRYNASNVMSNAGNRPAGISSNDSYNIIATYGCAKNILTLGAVSPIPGGYSQPSDAVLANFSSWGPTGDGRIKPDVVADGVNVLSSIGTNDNAYDIYSGTSMATPAAAGSVFLLQEYYSQLHAGAFMRSATLKGLVIHTADETGPSPGPDYQYGWGLIDMRKAASVITSDNSAGKDQFIQENNLTQGSHDVDVINVVASGKAPLVATIVWTDPTAPVGPHFDASLKLINDLDLRISDGTTTFKPWILDPANPSVAATTGDNIRDNVEKVEVGGNLVPGKAYTITVNHKGTLTKGSQAYSLLVSGAGGTAYCTSASTGPGASIDHVTLPNLDNAPGNGACRTYTDYTNLAAATLPIGTNTTMNIISSNCVGSGTNNNRVITVYIDFNNNGTFEPSEMVAQSASAAAGTYAPNIAIPATPVVGTYSRMRIIAEDNTTPGAVSPCGTYANGETQDYRVLFTAPPTDVGVTAVEYPTLTSCAYDSQLVVVRIRNFGTLLQTSTPVSTIVKNGATTIATLTAICKDTIAPGSDVLFTYNTTFPSVAGTVYTLISQTALAGDVNTSNDQNTTTLAINAASPSATGTATICSVTGGAAGLKANTTGSDLAFWYDTPTANVPIAVGNTATTTVVPSNKTYYLGVNDLKAKLAPANKSVSSGGTYFAFGGNFMKFTTSVPLTIESAKMYFGNPGKLQLVLATNLTISGTSISYIPVSTTNLDVYNTNPTLWPGKQVTPSNPAADTGSTFYLNIQIPVPGTYFLIINCLDGANAWLNTSTTALPYPFTLPGVMSITGNDGAGSGNTDTTAYKKFFYPLYNVGIRLTGCPGPRVPIVATTATAPTITLNGNVFTSSALTGNQWYRSGTPISGEIFQTDTAVYSGLYKTVVSDGSGCALSSNEINFISTGVTDVNGGSIALKISPNPNPGVFQLDFTFDKKADLSISLLNTLGQQVYTSAYPDFVGQFSRQINAGSLASGIYILKIQHGNDTYIKKILVKR